MIFMFRKLICGLFFVVSLIALVFAGFAIGDLSSAMGVTIDFAAVKDAIGAGQIMPIFSSLGVFVMAILNVFGLPLLVFLVSLIGLTLPRKRA
jgi:uncharacterized membrane protein